MRSIRKVKKMINVLLIIMLIAGLSLFVYLMNNTILKYFEDNHAKNALMMLYVTMIASFLIVMGIAYCFRTILIDITTIFYRS